MNTKTLPQAVERPALDSGDLFGDLVRKHNLAVESLTEQQLVEVIRQAIASGDIMRHVSHDDSAQAITYIPYREVSRLRRYVTELEEVCDSDQLKRAQAASDLDHVNPMQQEWEYRVSKWHGTHTRAKKLQRASDAELRLLCGELSAQEVRTIRAVLNFILPNTQGVAHGPNTEISNKQNQ